MHTYHIAPIDFGWENLKTVEETASELGALKARAALDGPRALAQLEIDVDDFLARWAAAKDLAQGEGWEGDFRQGPVVFWVPHESGFKYGFAFKQDNNGSTFVVSPYKMPWLE
ncbi:hypothetical protein SAMN05428966_10296 [Massilia sp. PDC64]|nr:hypothetical protein [Massilia sp. PDC64]SDC67894.1 hypothetical protein SAMN05428966_10296 [Massilia sp. PDC64]